MKTILVPIEDHSSIEIVMRGALMIGKIFNSYIEGVALGPDFTELAASDFSLSGMVFDEKTQRELLDEAQRRFQTFMTAGGLPYASGTALPEGQCSQGWAGPMLMTDRGLGEYSRVFDLIAVGKPANDINTPRRSTFETVLFDSGRPVLIVPPQIKETIGGKIAIVWNGSSETARTVSLAMPLIALASEIAILNVPHSRLPGPSGEALATSLRRHGKDVKVYSLQEPAKSQSSPGAALLAEAAELGADLLIKGGYTQSRLRELIFGSVTSEILADAQLPVLMAH